MSEPREIVLLTDAAKKVAEATTIDEAKQIRDAAESARGQSKKIDLTEDITIDAAAIKVHATRQLGQLLKATELAKGAPGNQYTGKKVVRSQTATGPLRLRDLGISKSESSRAQQVANLPAAAFDHYVSECVESRQEPTTAGLLRLVKQQRADSLIVPKSKAPARFYTDLRDPIATGQRFPTIYCDAPWRFRNDASRGAAINHYRTLTAGQIAAEPIAQLAADHAHLHLWCPNALLPLALEVIAAWQFSYRGTFVWIKSQMGVGNYWRNSHETMCLAVKNNLPFRDHSQRSWLEAARTDHSRKPEEIRALIEEVSPPPYLELYGRTIPDNPAWTVFGNQIKSVK